MRLRARFSREDFDRGVVALPKCVVWAEDTAAMLTFELRASVSSLCCIEREKEKWRPFC